jgi:hypothetical protein
VAYGVAGGDDEGAEDAAVLGGVEADAAHDEGVVTGGAQDVGGGGRGLEGPPHRFRVHGAAAALRPARRSRLGRGCSATASCGFPGVAAGGAGNPKPQPFKPLY